MQSIEMVWKVIGYVLLIIKDSKNNFYLKESKLKRITSRLCEALERKHLLAAVLDGGHC